MIISLQNLQMQNLSVFVLRGHLWSQEVKYRLPCPSYLKLEIAEKAAGRWELTTTVKFVAAEPSALES